MLKKEGEASEKKIVENMIDSSEDEECFSTDCLKITKPIVLWFY